MSFSEHHNMLQGDRQRLATALREALSLARTWEKRAADAADATETLGDDAALARITSIAKRARQDLSTLTRLVDDL